MNIEIRTTQFPCNTTNRVVKISIEENLSSGLGDAAPEREIRRVCFEEDQCPFIYNGCPLKVQ